MNDDKWGILLDRIQEQFGVLEQGDEEIKDVPNGRREFVIFEGPIGTMMLERMTRPKVIGEKSFGGSKYGTGSGIEKIYSSDEMVKTIKVYKDNDGDWEEIDASSLV
ncbi:MAG: hypothetical protein WC553_01795 [Patescibacteria group bacterium]